MRFNELKAEYNERYNNECYAGDEEIENMLGLFENATKMSGPARGEFARTFNFEYALDGLLFLGAKASAGERCKNIIAEAAQAGIKTITGR